MLGEALEACFGVLLTIGPAIEEGFYYDCSMSGRSLTDAERPMLESKIKQVHPQLHLQLTRKLLVGRVYASLSSA